MATLFKSKAAASLNKGHPTTFYSSDKPNPVLQALDQERNKFMSYMRKRNNPDYEVPDREPWSRPADILFELWNKYEPRLPKPHCKEKMLEMGDFLASIGEYKLALWQCYERCLQHYGPVSVEEICNVDLFQSIFFPGGFEAEDACFTFRALLGKSISMYQVVRLSDPKLQSKQSVDHCVHILHFLRLVMQVLLPRESLCWLLFNGTVHIYNISRHLMSLGHSTKVLEYFLWAAMCMETSVPLMTVKYLSWRATLYTAVCQCYYDCKAGQQAEVFARRALSKLNELSQLESLSNSVETPQREYAFRQATVRMAVMIFKRSVFETRRKPKGLLRPKTRSNLKDAVNESENNVKKGGKKEKGETQDDKQLPITDMPWPRTPTEKMLVDMFEGGSAQFLAILESLSDSNRRILLSSPPTQDNEPEILDVFVELFIAAQEILAGGGGNKATGNKTQMQLGAPPLSAVVLHHSLIDMATRGEDGVPLEAAIRLVKLAYNYELWDTFDALLDPLLEQIKEKNDTELTWEEKSLELLQAMIQLTGSRRLNKRSGNLTNIEDSEEVVEVTSTSAHAFTPFTGANQSGIGQDDLTYLADVLISIVKGPFQQENIEIDMVVDATLYLWSKSKSVFQKFQTGSVDNPRYLHKIDNLQKWMKLLDSVHQALGWTGISSVDPCLTAEVALRLAMVYESFAILETSEDLKKESKTTVSDADNVEGGGEGVGGPSSLLSPSAKQAMVQYLCQARDILALGLENVNNARQAVSLNDGRSIADVSWIKELFPKVFQSDPSQEEEYGSDHPDELASLNSCTQVHSSTKGAAANVLNTVKDLHLEMIMTYHRITIRLAAFTPQVESNKAQSQRKSNLSKVTSKNKDQGRCVETFEDLVARCRCNKLSKALLYMQRASMLGCDNVPSDQQKTLLDNAKKLIQKAQVEEQKTYKENTGIDDRSPVECSVPPPPILLCRTNRTMVFCPAPFQPVSGQKVAWYRLFGRNAAGSNIKARMNDNFLPGTGDEVTSCGGICELKVSGLTPDECYVFAVAAYAADGTLIGDSIGATTAPILASHPLPILITWAYLCQICYQVGYYSAAQQACEVLWNHFLATPPSPEGDKYTTQAKKDFKLTLLKLNRQAVCLSSPVLLRQFLTSIFINVESSIRINGLFCDVLCDQGPLYPRQIKRLKECEKMVVAIELAGWLNEANLALQAVVQCYGLLAPLLYYKIPAIAVIQVLQHCHGVLQEIPPGLLQKRHGHVTESLHHMTACITYHLAKVLRTWGQKQLARNINETGRRLLAMEPEKDLEKGTAASTAGDDGTASTKTAPIKKKISGQGGAGGSPNTAKGAGGGGGGVGGKKEETNLNEELKALEAHMLKVNRAAAGEHELSGTEDPTILHAYIAYLPSKLAYREVAKFKRRSQFLEFFVYAAQKGLSEGEVDEVINWCREIDEWLRRRNESIIGPRMYMSKQADGTITLAGDDPKKFAAAMVEYRGMDEFGTGGKDKKNPTGGGKGKDKDKGGKQKQQKYKPIGVTPSMSDTARQAQEQAELKALAILSIHIPDLYHNNIRKRRLRKITQEEMPWRCQMNMVQGLCHFGALLQKLEKREKLLGSSSSKMYKTGFLDPEWFTFETAGTLVVGWEGCPTQHMSRHSMEDEDEKQWESAAANKLALDLATEDRPKTTGIEFAAAAATGAVPPPLYPIPPETEDTPRSYQTDFDDKKAPHPINPESFPLSTQATIEALTKTFAFFKSSVVLAYRGQHWTLLQNGTRALWNCLHTAILRAVTLAPEGQEPGLLTMATLSDLVWHPLYMAADCILDMLFIQETELRQHAMKDKSRKMGPYFESWMGSIEDERGAASLKFEDPLDDLSIVDARWVQRLVLRCLEMLYHQEKWEKLVDVALRFSALSNDRYAEQVVPLLVQAQRRVADRIASVSGSPVPQPHYMELQQRLGHLVSARDYLTAQLRVHFDPARTKLIKPGAQIDPLGHDAYTVEDAYRLSSVPLDTSLNLQTLRDILNNSNYTARALRHSRKMLILYLAGQQNTTDSLSHQPSKVDFVPKKAQPQPTAPPDLSEEEFLSEDDVQSTPIPRSQLGQVIISYENTIKLLLSKKQKGIAAQALQELGNIYYHANDIRAAYRCWAESLDLVLGMTDAIRVWRQETQTAQDVSQLLLERCGLWGCVTGGVLASNIAQYILAADLGLRMECCFLSGYFFKALFRASLPHPSSDRDYALYDVGEGCEVTNLVPGIDFMSDHFRCNGRSLAAALRWVTEELARGRHNLFVLPLLTLYQYFMTFICRDLQRAVDGRILKVRVLTDLGLFSEALTVLLRLLHGERLPHTGDSSFRQVESRRSQMCFSTNLPINDISNLKVLEQVLDKRLPSNLATLFGPHLTCHLSLVQSHLFVALADTIPVLPAMADVNVETLNDLQTISTISRGGLGSKSPKIAGNKNAASAGDLKKEKGKKKNTDICLSDILLASEPDVEDEGEDFAGQAHRFTSGKTPSLEFIKATLLSVADQMVTTISEVICENASHEKAGLAGLSAAELELVVLCRLEQSAVAMQKHHAPLAARILVSGLKLLQNSNIFKPRKPAPPPQRKDSALHNRPSSMKGRRVSGGEVRLVSVESNQFQYQNFQSRARLDARLWLNCRLALVHALNAEIRGMGEVKGPENKVLTELADCRHYCIEGLKEAEACGDVEVQAEFLIQEAILNIMEGRSLHNTISFLDNATELLQKVPCLSVAGKDLLSTCIIFRTDLQATSKPDLPSDIPTQHSLQAYLHAQKIILAQMEELGERIEHHKPAGQRQHLSVPVRPMENIYTVQVLRLAQLKLRIGHAMARTLAKDIRSRRVDTSPIPQWTDCLVVLSAALELMKVSARREASTEAEILLTLGKVQKMLVYLDNLEPQVAATTLLEAISVSYANDHDLGLIRQAYLELAQIFLYSSGTMTLKEGTFLESSLAAESSEETKTASSSVTEKKNKTKMTEESSKAKITETEKHNAAWVAIRCAAAAAQALRARSLLIGNTTVTSKKVVTVSSHSMPDFACLDLMSAYVLGEKKKVFKSEIEEELAPLSEAEAKAVESYDDQVNKTRVAAKDLSWLHLLGYQTILQRLVCTATIAASSTCGTGVPHEREEVGNEFDLGFISQAQFYMGQNYNAVRNMLFSGFWCIRLNHLHHYLCATLPAYASDCCAIFPPSSLLTSAQSTGQLPLSPAGIGIKHSKPSDKNVLSSSDNDVVMQWHQPSLGEADPSQPELDPADTRLMLFYAVSCKNNKPQLGTSSGHLWVSMHKVTSLHDRLCILAQQAEIALLDYTKSLKEEPVVSSKETKPKKTQRLKPLSPKMQSDEQIENLLRQCMDDCASLMGLSSEEASMATKEIPFKVSTTNLRNLEQLFDPALGMMLTGTDLVQWLQMLLPAPQ